MYGMYVRVCMFTSRLSVTVSMERNSINWAKGRGLSKESTWANLPCDPLLVVTRALRCGYKTRYRAQWLINLEIPVPV